jgi:3-oxoacyl-[acyl-carrier-protein] synthase-1
MRDVVVTGSGVCCNLGDDLGEIVGLIERGEPGPIVPWQPAIDAGARCHLAALYDGVVDNEALGISRKQSRFMGRASRLALKAARAAIARADVDVTPFAVVAASGAGDVDAHIETGERLAAGGARKVSPTAIPRLMASTVSANLVNILRTRGPSFSAVAACAGGPYNILLASQLIASGHVDGAVAGGAEVVDLHFYGGFEAMRAFNSSDNDDPGRASRPYAADRAGFIFGEGAGMLVLEAREVAEARGAEILAVIRGFGMSSDGDGEMVAPASEGAFQAMSNALAFAKLEPADIDYINTHGTSTPLGDVSEANAIRRLMDNNPVLYSSTKGYTGHTITATGAIEAAFTIEMLRGGWVAPSINASPVDPALEGYEPILEPTKADLKIAMSNSFGFGGTNVSLILATD